jgi:N6-adenosine-specific RNA methylase IME4
LKRDAKVLENFLGATKEIYARYVELAGITEAELNQIKLTLISRQDRKPIVKMLAAKGLSTRQIAEATGWGHSTVANDLKEMSKNGQKSSKNGQAKTGSAATKAHRAAIAKAKAAEGVTDAPTEKYRIVYADPAWDYGAHEQPDYQTEQADHYPVMPLEEICALPVQDWVEDDAVLFLWVTSPIFEKAFHVVRAWGFEYKASFVWDKIKHNMGHYNSVRRELLLICTRGSCHPDSQELFDSVQSIERGKHSAKPVEFYDIIETLYTHGRKLEMFARSRREGWDVYGHLAEMSEAAE